MSHAPTKQTINDLNYWVGSSPSVLGNNIGGLKNPDQVAYFVCENSTDNGVDFDYPPFEGGRVDGVLRVLDATAGQNLFEKVSAAFKRKKFATDMVESDNDGVVALWNAGEQIILFVGDTSGSFVQDMWYDTCRFASIPPFEEGATASSLRFNVTKLSNVPADLAQIIGSLMPSTTRSRATL